MSRPLAEIMHSNWRKLTGLDLITWDELSLDELLKSAGDAQKLTSLVQQRYDMPREGAGK